MNEIGNDFRYFNYTRVTDLYGENYNLAPRFHWTSPHYHVYFVDLEREVEIGVGAGVSKSTDLAPQECEASVMFEIKGYAVGDKLSLTYEMDALWYTMCHIFDYYTLTSAIF